MIGRRLSTAAVALVVTIGAAFAVCGPAVAQASLAISGTLGQGEVGLGINVRLVASGGVAPYNFTAPTGLPAGFALSTAGVLTGAPTTAGTLTFAVTVTDADHETASTTLPYSVISATTITTQRLASMTSGLNGEQMLSATGGAPPYSWSVPSGRLPGGMLLSTSGVLSGRPSIAGRSALTVRATDALGATATKTFAFTVLAPPAPPPPPQQVLVATSIGHLYRFATATAAPASATVVTGRIVAVAASTGGGYWAVSRQGHVFGVGVASLGSLPHRYRGAAIVGIAADPRHAGYWLVTARGHVFGVGVASLGSLPHRYRGAAIVGIAADPRHAGYWLVTARGRVYGFGAVRAGQPHVTVHRVVGIAADPAAAGYWLVTSGGRVIAGGAGARSGHSPKLGEWWPLPAAPKGAGYWLVTARGRLAAFGTAVVKGAIPGADPAPTAVAVAAST